LYLHVPTAAIQSAVCLKTDPLPLPKPVLRTVRSNASHFNFRYSLVSLSSSTNCLRLLIRLHFPSILSVSDVFQNAVSTQCVSNRVSITSFYCMQDVLFLLDSVYYLYIFSRSVQLIFCILLHQQIFKIFNAFFIYFPKCSVFSTMKSYAPNIVVLCSLISIPVQSAGVSLEHFNSARILHLFFSNESHNKYRLFS